MSLNEVSGTDGRNIVPAGDVQLRERPPVGCLLYSNLDFRRALDSRFAANRQMDQQKHDRRIRGAGILPLLVQALCK